MLTSIKHYFNSSIIFFLFGLTLLLVSKKVNGQIQVQAGFSLPVSYTLGLEAKPTNIPVSLGLKYGILAPPFDDAIFKIIDYFGNDELLTKTIQEANPGGFILQPELKYHRKNFHIGIQYAYIKLNADDVPEDIIENYYGVDLRDSRKDRHLYLESRLHNIGFNIGYTFYLTKKKEVGVISELSFSKTISSNSDISADKDYNADDFKETVQTKLNDYYWEYGYLPSINILLFYQINWSNN